MRRKKYSESEEKLLNNFVSLLMNIEEIITKAKKTISILLVFKFANSFSSNSDNYIIYKEYTGFPFKSMKVDKENFFISFFEKFSKDDKDGEQYPVESATIIDNIDEIIVTEGCFLIHSEKLSIIGVDGKENFPFILSHPGVFCPVYGKEKKDLIASKKPWVGYKIKKTFSLKINNKIWRRDFLCDPLEEEDAPVGDFKRDLIL